MPRRLIFLTIAAIALVLCASAVAILKFTPASLKTAKVKVGKTKQTIVVDNRGVTVYELGGESAGKLICASKACISTWIPVRISSSTPLPIAKGVPGPSMVFRRVSLGYYQEQLDHHPVYYYAKDKGTPGKALGNGIHYPNSKSKYTWHVVKGS